MHFNTQKLKELIEQVEEIAQIEDFEIEIEPLFHPISSRERSRYLRHLKSNLLELNWGLTVTESKSPIHSLTCSPATPLDIFKELLGYALIFPYNHFNILGPGIVQSVLQNFYEVSRISGSEGYVDYIELLRDRTWKILEEPETKETYPSLLYAIKQLNSIASSDLEITKEKLKEILVKFTSTTELSDLFSCFIEESYSVEPENLSFFDKFRLGAAYKTKDRNLREAVTWLKRKCNFDLKRGYETPGDYLRDLKKLTQDDSLSESEKSSLETKICGGKLNPEILNNIDWLTKKLELAKRPAVIDEKKGISELIRRDNAHLNQKYDTADLAEPIEIKHTAKKYIEHLRVVLNSIKADVTVNQEQVILREDLVSSLNKFVGINDYDTPEGNFKLVSSLTEYLYDRLATDYNRNPTPDVREEKKELEKLWSFVSDLKERFIWEAGGKIINSFRFNTGSSFVDNLTSRVDSCLEKEEKDFSLLHELDPAARIIGLYAHRIEEWIPEVQKYDKFETRFQIGKAITYVADDTDSGDKVFVVEGVILNDDYRSYLGDIWKQGFFNAIESQARKEGIDTILFNYSLSESQQSALEFLEYVAEKLELSEAEGCKKAIYQCPGGTTTISEECFETDGDYVVVRGLNSRVKKIKFKPGNKTTQSGFNFTHHIEKEPIPDDLISQLKNNESKFNFNGEGYFESPYDWIKHCYENMGDQKGRQRYSDWEIRKANPQWNNGSGYINAIEYKLKPI
ncbi:hypothetical protein GF396_02860 [Candidatus Pacearchaeota archaeon]|nr:hypothetical protein [Candidatus Pacearchaeota archaeon]